jgi:small subunit ribosomal protein S9
MAEKETFNPGERKYIYKVGRRKEAVAQVRVYPQGNGTIIVNGKPLQEYFPTKQLVENAISALRLTNQESDFDATILVKGGGVRGQA